MRNIVILRGPQGSGKTRLAVDAGLSGHMLSYDMVRQVVSGDTLHSDGSLTIPQQHNGLVRQIAHQSLERRMEDGETILFEATMPAGRDVRTIADMAARHGYAILVVDLYATPLAFSQEGNRNRPERVRLSDGAIERCYKLAENQTIPDGLDVVTLDASDAEAVRDAIGTIRAFLGRDCRKRDLSSYERIVHIGDLQGCLDPILDPASPLAGGLRDDTFHVFTGDLFDRGPQNGEVARWWLDNAHGRANVLILAGNHEDHVEIEARGGAPVSREFADRTLPQLKGAGITRPDLALIASALAPVLHYEWRGTEVLCSHGGFPRWPTDLALVPDTILRRGVGFYQSRVDAAWTQNEAARQDGRPRWQVHGHRNPDIRPVVDGLSINLEGQVEFGGHMRFAVLDAAGWHPIEIRSRNYRTMQEARMIDEALGRQIHGDSAPIAPWARQGLPLVPVSEATFDGLRAHQMVNESPSETIEGVSAFNFSKEAFWGKAWDEMTTHARGLFIDTTDRTVSGRSYIKFWNHGERRETSDEGLRETVAFPVQGYDKANGYLCITGYCERTGELLVASKSRLEGPFAEWARAALELKLGAAGLERLLRVNRDQHASCVFEIVDPVNDPHIIKEAEVRVVLLDCVRRDENFDKMPYEDLVKLAAHLGCEVKKRLFHNIRDWSSLQPIMDRIENDPNWLKDSPTEGVVFEDRNLMAWKCKAHFYASWKRARSAIERIALCRRKELPFDRKRYEDTPSILAFVDWAQTLPDEALALDIVALRDLWFEDPRSAEAMGPPPSVEKPKDQTGFLKGIDAIVAQIDAGTAKLETVARLVSRAAEDPERLAAFDGHPQAKRVRAFAAANTGA